MNKKIQDTDIEIPKKAGRLFLLMVQPFKFRAFIFLLLTGLGMLAWTASPVVISRIVTLLGEEPTVDSAIWLLAGGYLLLRIIDEVFWRFGELEMRTFKPQMVERIRTILFSATLKKPHSFFVNSSSGRIGHWINQATMTTNDFIDVTIWTVWPRILTLVISTVFLFLAHWSLALIFAVWLILLFWFTTHRGKEFGRLIALQSDESSKASGIVVDSLSNHLTVRVFNSKHREEMLLKTQQKHIIKRWRDSWIQNIVTNIVKGQSAAIVSSMALGLILFLFSKGIVGLGDIVLFIAYFTDASSSLWQLAWAIDSYYRNVGTVQNALDGLHGADERVGSVSSKGKLPKKVNLKLQSLTFAYQDQKDVAVLSDFNLEISEGEKIGVVGHSGAGKSTLVGLLLGLYEPTSGEILINDEDILQKDPSFVRDISAFVPQDTNLFNRTLRENIMYANPMATKNQLDAALRQAEALDFVNKLPKGLDTLVGERGVKLSGGQRQRIAIARAILKDAPLLLLDEATSALDSVSEQSIQRSLHKLMQKRTAVVIAHRLSTLKHLDKIIVLDGGKIVEQGTHNQLVKMNGIYADLWKRQKDGFIVE